MQQGASWRFALCHARDRNLLIWVTRGQGRVIVNGIRRGISMNNALYLPAGTLFSVDLPQGVQALLVESPAGLTGRLPQAPLLLRVRDSLAQAELTGEIDAMSRELSRDRPHLQEALEAHVRLIAVWLHRQVAAGAADQPPESAAERLARRYAMALARGFRRGAGMAGYAEALDVTPTHLSRTCRATCGKTAAELLTECRLHAARSALEAPAPGVQEIARDLGFASPAYFSRFIQTHTGRTPTALRAAWQARQGRG
ncbi:AraC family transcriptional regulator [Pseudoponticoccus marisrubri]|uniref:AraC family transcriptional regulator n=2 Tax=Pseudoponticoccus marisrubri TaxID=1685382 RepID=A0A0W7WNI2_9RHOB|nr:AraC family transcriptional regulator [Pseudoponticoccus marisrubri]